MASVTTQSVTDSETTEDPGIVAEELFAQAESKCISIKGFWATLTGKGVALEEAELLYLQAAYKFKKAKQWNRAGLSFANAAEMCRRIEHPLIQARHLVDAALCYKKVDHAEALKMWQAAGEVLADNGRFYRAGKILQVMAEFNEKIVKDDVMAGQCYARAAEYFKDDGNSESAAVKCLLKVADYAALDMLYTKAIGIYEEVGLTYADHRLLRWGATEIFFKSALMHLCLDVVSAREAVTRYEDQHPAFAGCRENVLIRMLVDATEENDVEAFSEAVSKYELIKKLDSWTMIQVRTIKQSLKQDVPWWKEESEIDLK